MKTIDIYLESTGYGVDDIAERSGLSRERVEAIVLGRWTPSPAERKVVAKALGVEVADVSWGHTLDPRNIRYRQFGLKEDF
jgi:lambda repressor-like predicted transcriptional regulator